MSSFRTNERIDETVCLYKFTGVYHSYTYFNLIHSNDTGKKDKTLIVIRSAWLITYQDKLADTLSKYNNVEFLSKEEISKVEELNCDWLTKAKFSEFAVNKGSVFSNIYNNNTEEIKKAVALATNALDDNYPVVEICILTIVPVVCAIIILCILGWLADRDMRKVLSNYARESN